MSCSYLRLEPRPHIITLHYTTGVHESHSFGTFDAVTSEKMAAYGSQTPSLRRLKRLPTRMLASSVAEPLMESYMFKQSHIFDAFNKRFFILFHGYLVYYVKEEDYRADHAQGHLAVSGPPLDQLCVISTIVIVTASPWRHQTGRTLPQQARQEAEGNQVPVCAACSSQSQQEAVSCAHTHTVRWLVLFIVCHLWSYATVIIIITSTE